MVLDLLGRRVPLAPVPMERPDGASAGSTAVTPAAGRAAVNGRTRVTTSLLPDTLLNHGTGAQKYHGRW
jgi:hypothetical protein